MIALIAGQGNLPVALAAALTKADRDFIVCELEQFPASERINGAKRRESFRIERVGSFIDGLAEAGVSEICMSGAIRRPPLDASLVDPPTMPLVPRMMQALESGDDAALRLVIDFFEEAGLTVRAAHELAPELLPEPNQPPERINRAVLERDVARAEGVIAAIGRADIGQACAVAGGQVLAVEALPGTDAMLDALTAQREGLPPGGILYKAPKPDQDRRVDLPAIGPDTVLRAARAGLSGIVTEAGGVMVLDRGAVDEALGDTGLFLWVRAGGGSA